MIVIVDMTDARMPLLNQEFVDPIVRIVQTYGHDTRVIHHTQMNADINAGAYILSGTALKDDAYQNEDHSWLRQSKCPILGICAGMHALVTAYGGALVHYPNIGMVTLEGATSLIADIQEVYALHTWSPQVPDGIDVIAYDVQGHIQAIATGRCYGVLFHPEVRNPEVIHRFLDMLSE